MYSRFWITPTVRNTSSSWYALSLSGSLTRLLSRWFLQVIRLYARVFSHVKSLLLFSSLNTLLDHSHYTCFRSPLPSQTHRSNINIPLRIPSLSLYDVTVVFTPSTDISAYHTFLLFHIAVGQCCLLSTVRSYLFTSHTSLLLLRTSVHLCLIHVHTSAFNFLFLLLPHNLLHS